MRKVVIGEHYRHKSTPDYAWAKVLEVLEPNQYPNTNKYKVAKCEWSVYQDSKAGMIKYFKLSDLIKP